MIKTFLAAFFFILSACSSQAPQLPQGVINKTQSVDQTVADVKIFLLALTDLCLVSPGQRSDQ